MHQDTAPSDAVGGGVVAPAASSLLAGALWCTTSLLQPIDTIRLARKRGANTKERAGSRVRLGNVMGETVHQAPENPD